MTSANPTGASSLSSFRDANEGSNDVNSIRSELNTLKDTVTDYISKASQDAVKTAKQTTSDVTNQVGSTAADIAKSTSEQAKTFASELERMGRSNPLGTIAGALLVGVVIGLLGRGRH
jgi:ElaB/YqjD/DUF883 family membrane-anchored ribosome-binding protein